MFAFLLLFFIILSSVGVVAYMYCSEEYNRWIASFILSLLFVGIFIYVRRIDVLKYANLTSDELKVIHFAKESLSVASFWCTAIITAMTIVSLPKNFEKLKVNKFPLFSIIFFSITLLMVWNI